MKGDRIGRQARLRVGFAAVVFEDEDRLLLTRRRDNGRWCLPSGGMERGESLEECCIREVWEETGLIVLIQKLVVVYSDPDTITQYMDGSQYQAISVCFLATVAEGQATPTNETSEVEFVPVHRIEEMNVIGPHRIRIRHALERRPEAFFR